MYYAVAASINDSKIGTGPAIKIHARAGPPPTT